jgi:hypothetical protein
MKLDGGIDTYSFPEERYKTSISPLGRKVVYLNENGWDGNREYANKYFAKGQVLTVKEIYVGRSSSEVEFVEFPDKKFNTVMFEDV